MIAAVDTCSLVAYLSDLKGEDVNLIDNLLEAGTLLIPPLVLTEILSDPKLPKILIDFLLKIPQLNIKEGYWARAAYLRAALIAKKFKARLGDALIAQSCLDHDVPLITRDKDFRHFVKLGRLKLFDL